MRRVKNGFITTVPVGVTLHCPMCKKWDKLEAGDEVFMLDRDASDFYCLTHMYAAMGLEESEEPEGWPEQVPRRAHRLRNWQDKYEQEQEPVST